MLRDDFPQRTHLPHATPERLRQVADELNTRPRKTLGRSRPTDLLAPPPDADLDRTTVDNRAVMPMTAHPTHAGQQVSSRAISLRSVADLVG